MLDPASEPKVRGALHKLGYPPGPATRERGAACW
jgi:hypothetical protein